MLDIRTENVWRWWLSSFGLFPSSSLFPLSGNRQKPLSEHCVTTLSSASGVNKSDVTAYPRVPDQCAFFNNKFLIVSSLGSFFIPCIIIFAIYYRIFLVIMTQARRTRQQWRPTAVIESAAAQHRSNADHLITSYYQERISIANPTSIAGEKTSFTSPIDVNETSPINTNHPLDVERNSLMLKLSTPVLTSTVRSSFNMPSSSADQVEDEERDDIALVIPHEQPNGNNQMDTLSINNHLGQANDVKANNNDKDQHRCHFPAKRIKMRLKMKTSATGTPVSSAVSTPTSNTKLAKRKAYSRMKKERKATQTLIIVLSKFQRFSAHQTGHFPQRARRNVLFSSFDDEKECTARRSLSLISEVTYLDLNEALLRSEGVCNRYHCCGEPHPASLLRYFRWLIESLSSWIELARVVWFSSAFWKYSSQFNKAERLSSGGSCWFAFLSSCPKSILFSSKAPCHGSSKAYASRKNC